MMRVWRRLGCRLAMIACLLLGGLFALPARAADELPTAELVALLGNEQFAVRQAASKALAARGESVLAAMHEAAKSPDLEVRWRSKAIIAQLTTQPTSTAWNGQWRTARGEWMKIEGHRWSSGAPNFGQVAGLLTIVHHQGDLVHADLLVQEGPTAGQTAKVILRLQGDTLHYCGTYFNDRPSQFRNSHGYVHYAFQRVKSP